MLPHGGGKRGHGRKAVGEVLHPAVLICPDLCRLGLNKRASSEVEKASHINGSAMHAR